MLIAREEHRAVSHAGNSERASNRSHELHVGIVGALGALGTERVRPGVQSGGAEREPKSAVVQRTLPRAVVAERARLREGRSRGVVDTAVDEESFCRLPLQFRIDRAGWDG